jgi:hypothetical protein
MALNQNTEVFRTGLRRLETIAHTLDQHNPTDPSLGSLVNFAFRHEFYFIDNLKQRTKCANVSDHAASHEGLGLMMRGLIEVFDEVLFEHKDNKTLEGKFKTWITQVGSLSELRTSTGRDIWMDLTSYDENDDIDVPSIVQYLIANNCLPQQCCDKDKENFTDYLVRYTPVFFDDIFDPLKSSVSLSWWKTSLESSRVFGSDPSTWNNDLQRLDKKESPRAQKILDHYFALTLQNEVEQVCANSQHNRKAKI